MATPRSRVRFGRTASSDSEMKCAGPVRPELTSGSTLALTVTSGNSTTLGSSTKSAR